MPATDVKLPEHVAYEVLEGEAIVLNLKAGTYHRLNPTATRMYELMAELGSLTAVRDALLAEYDVGGATLEADLDGLAAQLVARGLLESR